ncbi:arabinose ABC transporter substrate-binding protein [Lacrimispora sp.]|uniref:arabinose ABC transporter substrate-binding protein n=1 Tax=Lacrimispora sp. TaxID=2719234 RepID=UPI002FDAB2D1
MKKTTVLMMAAALAAGLTACSGFSDEGAAPATTGAETTKAAELGESTTGGTEKGVIYGIYKAGDQTWFIDEGAAAQAVVEEQGDEFIYVDAKMNPEEYLKAIDNAIANKAKGIVTCIPDQTMSQAVVDKCKEAGIPIVAADDALQTDAGDKIAPWVGINAYVIGEANGQWLADYANENNLAEDPECGLLIMTMDTVSSCVPRAEGEYDKFTEVSPGFAKERIFKADYDGTTEKGNVAATSVITAHPEIKKWLITGANEEGTIGAVRALESAGLDKDGCVVGLGGYLAKDEWNNKGADGTSMKAAAYFSSDSVGAGSVKVLYDVIAGKEVPMETAVDAVIVTPENYKEVMGKAAE